MNLTQIKSTLNIVALNLSRSMDQNSQPTPWLRYWDNKNRVAVTMHEDVLAIIKATPDTNKLALKYEQKHTKDANSETSGLAYDSYILIHAESIEDCI